MIDFLSLEALNSPTGRIFLFENKKYSLKGITEKLIECGLTEENAIKIISLRCKSSQKELI